MNHSQTLDIRDYILSNPLPEDHLIKKLKELFPDYKRPKDVYDFICNRLDKVHSMDYEALQIATSLRRKGASPRIVQNIIRRHYPEARLLGNFVRYICKIHPISLFHKAEI